MRDMRGMSGGGFGSSPGATEATLAAVSSSTGAPGGDGGGERRANAGATFSMPGVSALPGVETGGGGRAMAALEREGAVKESGRFTLE